MLSDTLPEGLEDGVKGLDTVRCGGFSEGSDSQSADGPDLLLLVHKTCRITDKTQKSEREHNLVQTL